MTNLEHFHFVGINGIGMSAIAKILYKQGHTISGCDLACNLTNIEELVRAGCQISNHHNAKICHDRSITHYVYSSDVSYDTPELKNARNNGIATIPRAEALAYILNNKKYTLGVAGSHGKTTTTCIIGHIFLQAHLDPTIIVGGMMQNISNNAHHGNSDYIIAETDESDSSHLLLPINTAVLTTIDFEHANRYKNLEEVIDTFQQFLDKIPANGSIIACQDDINITGLIRDHTFSARITTYGTNDQSDIRATHIQLSPTSSTFNIQGICGLESITINIPGFHNVLNATAAIATALQFDIPTNIIQSALATFTGVDRRFTYKGCMQSPFVEIFDDYAHHPSEIYHALTTARHRTKGRLIVIFQPQRYTRTFHLWKEFVNLFAHEKIDHLIITDIYSAHEEPITNVTSEQLVNAIQTAQATCNVNYIAYTQNLDLIASATRAILQENDLLLLVGAGKVNQLAQILL